MFKFENTHIFTGYIKQLLHNFNLPKYRVYTSDFAKYKEEHGEESPEVIASVKKQIANDGTVTYPKNIRYVNYIKNDTVSRYVDGKWELTPYHYHYNKKELNQTKNLVVKSNSYDSYTHEYLGDYLRFQRDYNDLDLMPLYNCFSNKICQNLDLTFTFNYNIFPSDTDDSSDSDSDDENSEFTSNYLPITKKIKFNSSDAAYKIYILPVKFFKKYTIAIDSPQGVEICCGFYNNYYDNREKFTYLPKCTYNKFNSVLFSAPVIYGGLGYDELKAALKEVYTETDDDIVARLIDFVQYEHELKMFIKVPVDNNSSITILEGDYTGYNQKIFNKKYILDDQAGYIIDDKSNFEVRSNKFIFNFATKNTVVEDDDSSDSDSDEADDPKSITTTLPDYSERPFVPYTDLQLLQANTGISYPFADRLVEYLLDNVISHTDEISDNIVRAQKVMELNGNSFTYEGAWEPKMKIIIYDYMHSTHPDCPLTGFSQEVLQDSLGYVDKDVEKNYTAWKTEYVYDNKGKPVALQGQYQPLNKVLTEEELEILQDIKAKSLIETHEPEEGEELIPIYKTVNKPLATIANVDIYDEIYLDSKVGGNK